MRMRKKVGKGKEITKEEKEERIDFTRKKSPKRGIVSFIMAIASFAGFISLSIVSAVYKGNAGMAVGIGALVLFLINIVGIFLPIACFKMKNAAIRTSIMGIVGNGLMAAGYIALYVAGLFT